MPDSDTSYQFCDIDFQDDVFLRDYQDYCIHSMPDKSMESKSISVRLKFLNLFLNKRKRSDLCLSFKKESTVVGYFFLKKNPNLESLYIDFVFPSRSLARFSNKDRGELFKAALLNLCETYKTKQLEGEIIRGAKLKGYIGFIKRYVKFVNLDYSDSKLIKATINKDDIPR
jgi:hypothetical protein